MAQYSFLFVVRSATCFGQIYWPFSGSYKQRRFGLELSRVVATAVMSANIQIHLHSRYCFDCLVAEPEGSAPLIQNPAIGLDTEAVVYRGGLGSNLVTHTGCPH